MTEWVKTLDSGIHRQNRSIVMIVNNCPAHPHATGLKAVTLVFLPPNSTSVTQSMDQGVIRSLKVNYRKRFVTKKLKMMDAVNVQAISILDALHMMKALWGDVKHSTIANCYRRAEFDPTPATPIDEEEDDADDNIALNQLARIMGATSMTEFINIYSHLPATEEPSEDDIIQDLLMQRRPTTSYPAKKKTRQQHPRHQKSNVFP